MRRRRRKLIGVLVTLAFVIVYGLFAMVLSQAILGNRPPGLVQWLAFAVAGLAWILPVMPLIRWMQRPDPEP